MVARHLFGRSSVGKIVQSHRFARHPFRTLQGIGMAMKGEIRGAEDHDPVEQWGYSRLTPGHAAIPKFQVPAVLLAPILVEVQQQVQATIQSIVAVPVEIRMNSKLAAPDDLVQAATFKTRVRNQVLDSRDVSEELQKCNGVQVIK